MKNIFLIITILLLQTTVQAQKVYAYYDTAWKETDKEHAVYYRTMEEETGKDYKYKIIDHYLNGIPQMELHSDTLSKSGHMIFDGYYIYFDSSGAKESEGYEIKGKHIRIWKYYSIEGNKKIVQERKILNDSERYVVLYDMATHEKLKEGKLINGKYEGLWKSYIGANKNVNAHSKSTKPDKELVECIYRNDKILTTKRTIYSYLNTGKIYNIILEDSIKNISTYYNPTSQFIDKEVIRFHQGDSGLILKRYWANTGQVKKRIVMGPKNSRCEEFEYYSDGKIENYTLQINRITIKSECYNEAGDIIHCLDGNLKDITSDFFRSL